MKATKKTKWEIPALVFALALMTCLVLVSCLSSDDDGNPFLGTWYGYDWDHDVVKIVVDQSTWTASYADYSWWGYETGTYTYTGNSATFFQDGVVVGTATISGSNVTATISGFGTFVLSKSR